MKVEAGHLQANLRNYNPGDSPANPVKANQPGNLQIESGDFSIQRTFLEEMMELFLADQEKKDADLMAKRKQNETDEIQFDIIVDLIKSQLGRLVN